MRNNKQNRRTWPRVIVGLAIIILVSSSLTPASRGQTNQSSQSALRKEWKVAIVPVEFSDIKHNLSLTQVSAKFSDANQLLQETSYDSTQLSWQLTPTWIQLTGKFANYTYPEDLSRYPFILTFATSVSYQTLNFSAFDVVVIVHAGYDFTNMRQQYLPGPITFSNPSYVVKSAIIVSEADMAGAILHEILHSIGGIFQGHIYGHYVLKVPDLYDENALETGEYAQIFMGNWDLMSGGYEGPAAWTKIKLGWIPQSNILELNAWNDTLTTLFPLELPSKQPQVIRIPLSHQQTQFPNGTLVNAESYYLVEYREKLGIDSSLPASGILVTLADDGRYYRGAPGPVKIINQTLELIPGKNNTFVDSSHNLAISVLGMDKNSAKVIITGARQDRGVRVATKEFYGATVQLKVINSSLPDWFYLTGKNQAEASLRNATELLSQDKQQAALSAALASEMSSHEFQETRVDVYTYGTDLLDGVGFAMLAFAILKSRPPKGNSDDEYGVSRRALILIVIWGSFFLAIAVFQETAGLGDVTYGIFQGSNVYLDEGRTALLEGIGSWYFGMAAIFLLFRRTRFQYS